MFRLRIISALMFLPIVWIVACSQIPKPFCLDGDSCLGLPLCSQEKSIEAIARDLDHIETHIDTWGSVTIKHPDLWGSARLLKYQQEVESIFVAEVDKANVDKQVNRYQGARARSDQAFLASAVALNAAISGKQAALLPPDPITIETATKQSNSKSDTETTRKTGSTTDQSQSLSTKSGIDESKKSETKTPDVITVPTSATIPNDLTTTTTTIKRNDPLTATMPGFASGDGLRLEPSVILDEKKRFLDHLNQIRRLNEGDDTADSPGYALYLMRVPVSVLPGKRTDRGHGAEISLSIKPVLGDELLPTTFRSLVINDLVDQFSELVTTVINMDRALLIQLRDQERDKRETEPHLRSPDASAGFDSMTAEQVKTLRKAMLQVKPKYSAAQPSRHAEYAYPLNHVEEIFGAAFVKALVLGAVDRFDQELSHNQVVHLHEVRPVIREQVVAAYRFLTSANPEIWNLVTPDLARAVRDLNGNKPGNLPIFGHYVRQYDEIAGRELGKQHRYGSDRLLMKALAWGVLVESALLTDQLVRDIKETMRNKGGLPTLEGWQDYYCPEPSPQARRAFQDYVACRWPMYTFAVDPVAEQQNIQDSLSQRREMQLALSLAFTSGAMSVQNFNRFARRLEADFQAVDLNRTVVGFSHGDNTFGWRFYPRFQTPEIPGTLQVIGRDLLAGRAFTKDQELRDRHLEPGQRECIALIIMPSFVPFAEVSVSSHWFDLANPKRKSHSTSDTIKLSQRLRSIELCDPGYDQERYRTGELGRLQSKAQMLSSRLSLQEMKFQVPFANTLGGFEFFNSGVTDLVPQLRGWYGAAGFEGKALDLYLVGDHFHVTNTKVVAGGKELTRATLLSREVVGITIPADAAISKGIVGQYSESGKFVEVRVATPYGIGGPLRIPYIEPAKECKFPPCLEEITDGQHLQPDRDTDLMLQGAYFTADTVLFVNGKACTVTIINDQSLRVTVPRYAVFEKNKSLPQVEVLAVNSIGKSHPILVPVAASPSLPPPKVGP